MSLQGVLCVFKGLLNWLLHESGLQRRPGWKNKVSEERAAVIQGSIFEAWTRLVVVEMREMRMEDHN